jgi:acyl carrier protein
MRTPDALLQLLIDFFDLPPDTAAEQIHQPTIPGWDSLAMVQLITELQRAFGVEFALDEIQTLRSYDEIKATLARKGVIVKQSPSSV